MADFPAIQEPFISMPVTVRNNAIASELMNGMRISRAKYTRQLREWSLTWNGMPNADLTLLLAFYDQVAGGAAAFSWQDQYKNTYTVRFASDIQHEAVSSKLVAVKVKLEEV